ncbi:MAG: RNA polymerase sigma factor [Patescibacteria group bacterium]
MSKISLDPNQEQKLVEASKKDRQAFGKLYEHYHIHIHRYVSIKVSNKNTAEDITSLVFQKAMEGIENFKWQGVSFSSWLYRIARNTVIDHYRAQNKESNNISLEYVNIQSKEKTPEESAIHTEFEELIEDILHTLPEREKQIVYMKFFEGYTNKTIAKLLEISESNVGTILHRTVKKLRKSVF